MISTRVKTKKRVFVGLSGGVDSAVSAALLIDQGFEVIGVFIKGYVPEAGEAFSREIGCTFTEDKRSAMKAAATLGIPFLTLDLSSEYKRNVVDQMIREYQNGNTPNPDVFCNKYIKFGYFFDFALANGADFVATGHYARIVKRETSEAVLAEPKDTNKSQTYFLWTLETKHLEKTIFPLCDLEKSQVRELAKKFGLPQATKKDSQGLCFLGKFDFKEFLKGHVGTNPGDVLDAKGNIIGSHDGVLLYTLGERHGFSVTTTKMESPVLYVTKKDLTKNTITVESKLEDTEQQKPRDKTVINLSDVNLTARLPLDGLTCRLKYRGELIGAKILEQNFRPNQNTLKVELAKSVKDAACGQSVVFYYLDLCLGGGIIVANE